MDSSYPSSPERGDPVPSSSSSSSFSDGWKERIFYPTVLSSQVSFSSFFRIVGGGAGLISKHRKVHGLANIFATYAVNFAIVAGYYYGARESVRASRKSDHDDLLNSAIAGFGTGAILGRLQGGQIGAARYSVIFAIVSTSVDFATIKLKPVLRSHSEPIFGKKNEGWLKLPEWSPIQVLDEEALANRLVINSFMHKGRLVN